MSFFNSKIKTSEDKIKYIVINSKTINGNIPKEPHKFHFGSKESHKLNNDYTFDANLIGDQQFVISFDYSNSYNN